jgi:hypothetical protein
MRVIFATVRSLESRPPSDSPIWINDPHTAPRREKCTWTCTDAITGRNNEHGQPALLRQHGVDHFAQQMYEGALGQFVRPSRLTPPEFSRLIRKRANKSEKKALVPDNCWTARQSQSKLTFPNLHALSYVHARSVSPNETIARDADEEWTPRARPASPRECASSARRWGRVDSPMHRLSGW